MCGALAEFLFGRDSLIRIDLTEYQQPHDVSRLIGAPPGYKGYGEGGQLTEKIRRRPRSVVLFDEVEKAHPDVLRILLRLLEDGCLTDSEGRKADFRHAVIVLTSNLGAGISSSRRVGFSQTDSRREQTEEEVRRVLSAELAARLDDIILFRELTKEDCALIAERELQVLAKRCEAQGVMLGWEPAAVRVLGVADRTRGARAVRDAVARSVTDPLAGILLTSRDAELVEVLVEDSAVRLRPRSMERV